MEKMSELINSTAIAYFLSYKCLINKHIEVCNFENENFSVYFIPAITTAAFSCELALKSILESEREKSPRGHDLNKLFNQLNQQTRIDIMKRTVQAYDFKANILGVSARTSEKDFFDLLASHKDTFITIRYFYEGTSDFDLDFIEAFMFCLNGLDDDYSDFVNNQLALRNNINRNVVK